MLCSIKKEQNKIKENKKKIYQLEKQILILKKENFELEKDIYRNCNHNWDKDPDDIYSRYKVCTKCKLANFPHIYK